MFPFLRLSAVHFHAPLDPRLPSFPLAPRLRDWRTITARCWVGRAALHCPQYAWWLPRVMMHRLSVWEPRAETYTAVLPCSCTVTSVGTSLSSSVSHTPSCPLELTPHANTRPSAATNMVCSPPAATCVTSTGLLFSSPLSSVGTNLFSVSPTPRADL